MHNHRHDTQFDIALKKQNEKKALSVHSVFAVGVCAPNNLLLLVSSIFR